MTLATVALLALAACGADVPGAQEKSDDDSLASGTFEGQITIGPICPVEPGDLPEGAAYMGHDLTFRRRVQSAVEQRRHVQRHAGPGRLHHRHGRLPLRGL
jgi:phage-related baseplate assembly protein